jgi:hypothetical protein
MLREWWPGDEKLKMQSFKLLKALVTSSKRLGPRGLFSLWSQVWALWLLIWWPLEAYMVVNFRARGISRGARKLARTPTLNLKKWRDGTQEEAAFVAIIKRGCALSCKQNHDQKHHIERPNPPCLHCLLLPFPTERLSLYWNKTRLIGAALFMPP